MKQAPSFSARRVTGIVALALVPIALGVTLWLALSASTVPCGGVTDCRDATTAPACGDTSTAYCHVTLDICIYQLENESFCPCVQGEVQICTKVDLSKGVQTCQKKLGGGTKWGICKDP